MFELSATLAKLSRAERRWIGLLVGAALPIALIFLLIEPLVAARAAAQQKEAAARDLLRWVETQAQAYPPGPGPAATATGSTPAVGLAGLEQSLRAAGLREDVTALAARGAGGVDLRFDRVGFTPLMAWAVEAEATLGYTLRTLTVDALPEPGAVAAALVLEPSE